MAATRVPCPVTPMKRTSPSSRASTSASSAPPGPSAVAHSSLVDQVVQLDQVDVVDAAAARASAGAGRAHRRRCARRSWWRGRTRSRCCVQPRRQAQLRVAVPRGGVDVVDAVTRAAARAPRRRAPGAWRRAPPRRTGRACCGGRCCRRECARSSITSWLWRYHRRARDQPSGGLSRSSRRSGRGRLHADRRVAQEVAGPRADPRASSSGLKSAHTRNDRQPHPMQAIESVAEPLQHRDLLVELGPPRPREPGPVRLGRGAGSGSVAIASRISFEGQPDPLGDPDERHPPQRRPGGSGAGCPRSGSRG